MDIQPALDTVSNFATQSYETGKAFALWSGHQIQSGFTRYAVPAGEKLYALAVASFRNIGQLFSRGPSAIFAVAGGLFLAGIAAFKIADRKAYEGDLTAKSLWKTAGIAAFIAATAVTTFGIGTVLAV